MPGPVDDSPRCPQRSRKPRHVGATKGLHQCPVMNVHTLLTITISITILLSAFGGFANAQSCDPGFYASSAVCTQCPTGFYCLGLTNASLPCPAGTANPLVQQTNSSACLPCSPGEYSAIASTVCTPCPAGFECPSTSSTPSICSMGSYSTQGSTTCQGCPGGYECPIDGSQQPTPCTNGTFSPANSTSCSVCMAGYSCLEDAQVACGSGSFSGEGVLTCTLCPEGYSCPSNTTGAAVSCGKGTFAPAGSSTCTPCPAGSYSKGGVASCLACSNGTIASEDRSTCISCDAGFSCIDPAAGPVPCANGTYSLGGVVLECTSCPEGYECPNRDQSPVRCAEGLYALEGAVACEPCPANNHCYDRGAPQPCDDGEYSPEGESSCLQCKAGFNCTSGQAVVCPSGYFSRLGDVGCTICPAGSECPYPYLAPVSCSHGYFAEEGSTTCTICPAGSQCSSRTSPIGCPAGHYSQEGASACIECPPGHACLLASADPVACEAGSYSDGQATNCTLCPAGLACPSSSDSSLIYPCPSGTFSALGEALCTPCPAGFACPLSNVTGGNAVACQEGAFSRSASAQCLVCPAGWVCLDGELSYPCLAGTFSEPGSANCTMCAAGTACPLPTSNTTITCTAGQYSLDGASACTSCPRGHACPDTNTMDTIYQCPAGFYSLGMQTTCTACPAGFACPSIYDDTKIECGAGQYSVGNQTNCISCPAGMYCADTLSLPESCPPGYWSATASTACSPCPAGYQCSDQTLPPVVCPSGSYSHQLASACSPCSQGYSCPVASTVPNATADLCPAGAYCLDGVTVSLCPEHTYNPHQGKGSLDDCLPCTPGYYCPIGTERLSTNNLCEGGYYCNASRVLCPSGTYNEGKGLVSVDQCVTCPSGMYCPIGTIYPHECPRGNYCPPGQRDPIPCPAGTFNNETNSEDMSFCAACIEGYYCPEGSTVPTPCSPGTFNPYTTQDELSDCLDCLAGHSCPEFGTVSPTEGCQTGHYCPLGTVNRDDYPCPSGTLMNYQNATSAVDCQSCPERFACPEGTGGSDQVPIYCAAGHYCPAGTSAPTDNPCAAGSYTNRTDLRKQSECMECERGFFCLGGDSAVSGECPEGYYCPAGTQFSTQYPCPAGTYNNVTGIVREESCVACPQGMFCPEASTTPTPCPQATYSSQTGLHNQGQCATCDAGFYCPTTGMTAPLSCPAANYSTAGSTSCPSCEPGYYCPREGVSQADMLSMYICPAGVFCLGGRDQAPDRESDACPAGFYCYAGDENPSPQPCSAGSFLPYTGAEDETHCLPCPKGKYCNAAALSAPVDDCPAGYFCPEGTDDPNSEPCPQGYYIAYTGAESNTACAQCPRGTYCGSTGTSAPTPCPPGHYCPLGSSQPAECPRGTYSNATGLTFSESCLPCPPGKYCATPGITQPTGDCAAGFYCISRSTTQRPEDGTTGDICPAGGYCVVGSIAPQPCSAGTFSATAGASDDSFCNPCTPGSYCEGSSTPEPTGLCFPGYYCTGGASTPTQFPTTPGHYAEEGASNEDSCLPGTYQPDSTSSSCLDCLTGFVCSGAGTITPDPCPMGGYCPQGSAVAINCPVGTYNDEEGAKTVDDCKACPSGSWCGAEGLTSPSGDCDAGYYCDGSATTPTPSNALEGGGPCPAGYYCLQGTVHQLQYPCPRGTFAPSEGLQQLVECTQCTPGSYCETIGLDAPTGTCSPGYYCNGGVDVPNPTTADAHLGDGDICPLGHECPDGTGFPQPCQPGTYANSTAMSGCETCPAGYSCTRTVSFQTVTDGVYDLDLCEAGYFCPAGTGLVSMPCPAGTYSGSVGLTSAGECTPCPAGQYCADAGATNLAETNGGLCSAGYYCLSGIDIPEPTSLYAPDGGPCPAGHYCEEGTSHPTPCPLGTFSNTTGVTSVSECLACLPGQYCGATGLQQPSGPCESGYYCSGNATTATPPFMSSFGGLCPAGHYCGEGTGTPFPCEPGTYAASEGMANCSVCPARYFCPSATANYAVNPCPSGYFCPEGSTHSTDNPCPAGSYGAASSLASVDECTPCPPGSYCDTAGLSAPTGLCDAGYYCMSGSSTNQPSHVDGGDPDMCPFIGSGDMCPIGHFCPEGSSAPLVCVAGTACTQAGLGASDAVCAPGYACYAGATTATPTDGIEGIMCPPGYYCEAGSSVPIACPAGTYSNSTGATALGDCLACPIGFACEGLASTAPTVCSEGYFCNGTGFITPTPPENICPQGYYCPEGTADRILCPSGSYQSAPGAAECITCPSSFVCDSSLGPVINGFATVCSPGYYCPVGTQFSSQYPCPQGTYNPDIGASALDDCASCLPGSYCATPHLTSPTGDCMGGYYCTGGAIVNDPTDGVTGDVCPLTYYCPSGVSAPLLCPEGSETLSVQRSDISDCSLCKPGHYCTSGTPATPCDAGYVCVSGSTVPRPLEFAFNQELQNYTGGFPCPAGSYCPEGSGTDLLCPSHTFQPSIGQGACLPCPPGRECIGSGLISTEVCSAGYYCEEGQPRKACPPGTFGAIEGLSSESQCAICPQGYYCNGTGMASPDGLCEAGYYCPLGQSSPAPPDYLCGVGRYCEEGSRLETRCPLGTYNPLGGGMSVDDCISCTPGYYCGSFGLSAPTGPCTEGYYCPEGVDNVLANPSSYQCPEGMYCPSGSPRPLACTNGTYQPLARQAECLACPAGYYCNSTSGGVTTPISCPTRYYCPTGSETPTICPAGTYGSRIGLTGSAHPSSGLPCSPCPATMYCTEGVVAGECSAGYICISSSPSPAPDTEEGPARLCDPGHYCTHAATELTPCPEQTFRNVSGAEQESQCFPCPAGSICDEGTADPLLCPEGFYCEEGEAPTPCPTSTYSAALGASSSMACTSCPAGYFCSTTGIADFTLYPCPADHYCPEGTGSPIECPAGTRFNGTGLAAESGCRDCAAGFYCPGVVDGRMQFLPCPGGSYCMEGSTEAQQCPGGYYCPPEVSNPLPCPSSHYCPAGSVDPLPCEFSHYCPAMSSELRPCPEGYKGRLTASVDLDGFADIASACDGCPSGTYAANSVAIGIGTPSNITGCNVCEPGMFCPFASGVDASTALITCESFSTTYVYPDYPSNPSLPNSAYYCPCPAGSYCEEGTNLPTPCPAGTYNAFDGQSSEASCLPCPAGTYNNIEGQSSCRVCGSSATSEEGSLYCTCIGQFRVFSAQDGECTCQSGFVYYDEAGNKVSDGDNRDSCQPETVEACSPGEIYYGGQHLCVDPSNPDQVIPLCAEECLGSSNVIGMDVTLGLCRCASYDTLETACDEDCEADLAYLACTDSSRKRLFDMNDNLLYVFNSCPGLRGICLPGARITATVREERNNETAVVGAYTNIAYWFDVCGVPLPAEFGGDARRRRAVDNSTLATIGTPLICAEIGDAVSFQLSRSGNMSLPNSYPVYDKNHPLNTNDVFDFGAFRSIGEYVDTTVAPLYTFVHSFAVEGLYVFYDSARPTSHVFVKVVSNATTCQGSRLLPATSTNFQLLGASTAALDQQPDLMLVVIFLGAIGGIVLITALFLVLYQPHKWAETAGEKVKPQYLERGPVSPYVLSAAGKELSRVQQEDTLEGLTVRELFDHLDKFSKVISKELADQDVKVKGQLMNIQEETTALHSMVQGMDVEDLRRHLQSMVTKSTALSEAQQERLQKRAQCELELMDKVNTLLHQLNSPSRRVGGTRRGKAAGKDGDAAKSTGPSSDSPSDDVGTLEAVQRSTAALTKLQDDTAATRSGELDDLLSTAFSTTAQKDPDEKTSVAGKEGGRDDDGVGSDDTGTGNGNGSDGKTARDSADKLADNMSDLTDASRLAEKASTTFEDNGLSTNADTDNGTAADALVDRILASLGLDDASVLSRLAEESAHSEGHDDFTADELEAIDAFMRARLGDDYKKLVDPSSQEYAHARQQAEDLVCQIRHDALKQREEEARSQAVFDKNEAETDLMVLKTTYDQHVSLHPTAKEIDVNKIAAHCQNLRVQVREKLRDAAARRKGRRLKKVDQDLEAELNKLEHDLTSQDRGVGDGSISGTGSSSTNTASSRDARRRKLKEAREKAQRRADRRKRGITNEEDASAAEVENKVIHKLRQDEVKMVEEAMKKSILSTVDSSATASTEDDARAVQRGPTSEEDAEKILSSFNERRENALQHIKEERNQQRLKLQQRLKAQREKRKLKLDSAIAEATTTQDVVVGAVEISSDALIELEAMEKTQQRMEEELRQRHEEELRAMEQAIEKELQEKEKEALNVLESKHQQMLEETKSRLEAELRVKMASNKEDAGVLMAQHSEQMRKLTDEMSLARSKQEAAMRERLAKRREKKKRLQEQAHKIELEQELIEQKAELNSLKHDQIREAERDVMVAAVQDTEHEAEMIVSAVLQQRHAEELSELHEWLDSEHALALDKKRNELQIDYDEKVDERTELFAEDSDKLKQEAKQFRWDDKTLQKRLGSLKEAFSADLIDLQSEFENDMEHAELATNAQFDIKRTEALLRKKEVHYQEFADALRDVDPHSEDSVQAEERAAELEKMREELELQRQQQFRDMEQNQRAMIEKLIAEFEENERKADEEQREKIAEQLKQLEEEKKIAKENALQAMTQHLGEIAVPDSSVVVENYHRNQATWQEMQKAQKAKAERLLLERRRRRKMRKNHSLASISESEAGVSEPEPEPERPQGSADSEALPRVQEEESERNGQRGGDDAEDEGDGIMFMNNGEVVDPSDRVDDEPKSRRGTTFSDGEMELKDEEDGADVDHLAPLPDRPGTARHRRPKSAAKKKNKRKSVMTAERLVNSLPETGLFARLSAIETALRAKASPDQCFVDELSKTMTLEGPRVVEVAEAELSADEALSLTIGRALVEWLARDHGYPQPTLHAAQGLPAVSPQLANDYVGNAYRRAIFHDVAAGTVFVRREYLERPELFLTLVTHTVSHLSVGDMTRDDLPAFLAAFHKTIRLLLDRLFTSTVRDEVNKLKTKKASPEERSKATGAIVAKLFAATPPV